VFAAIISTIITGGIIAALIVGLILGSFAHWIIASAIVAAGLLWFGDKKGWLKI
jgi:hypothetical protein